MRITSRFNITLLSLSLAIGSLLISADGFSAAPIQVEKPGDVPAELKDIAITEHLGQYLTYRDLKFRDEQGNLVPLSTFFRPNHPVLLSLVYFECPNLCNLLLNGMVTSLKKLDWTPGQQFDIVTVSIDPKEKSDLAFKKKQAYLESYGRTSAANGWHFLTGSEDQIKNLAAEIGFGYRWDARQQQFAHSAAIYVLTPEAKISRYLYGIDFFPKDLKLALLEASNGKVGNVIDRLILFCYRYDPQLKTYSLMLTRLMQAACGLMVFLMGGYLMWFWRRQFRAETYSEKGASISC